MTQKHTTLTLAELRARIENDTVSTSSKPSILAFLDLTHLAIGAEAFRDPSVLASPAAFSAWFPALPDNKLAEAFGDGPMYSRCRNSIERHVRLAGAWPDEDPFSLLNQLAREYRLPGVNRKLIETVFPGVSLRKVTREMAMAADRNLRGNKRNAFRNSFSTIDKLRGDPRVIAANILGDNEIGSLPTYRDGNKLRVDLPPMFAKAADQLPPSHALRARRAFELAVDFGLFGEDGPPLGWAISIEDASRYHVSVKAKVSENTADLNLRALLLLLEAAIPGTVPENVTADRVKRPQRYSVKPKPQARRTESKPMPLPDWVEAEVAAFAKDRSAGSRRLRDLRRVLQSLLQAGFDIEDPTFFADAKAFFKVAHPDYSDLTLRSYRTVLQAFLAHTNRLGPWECVVSRAQISEAHGVDRSGLLRIKKYAESAQPAIPPAEIDLDVARQFLLKAQAHRDVPRCLAGLAALDALRPELPGLLPGPEIGDLRAWLRCAKGKMSTVLEAALRSDAEAAGYGEFGAKELIVAARRLYALTPDKTIFDASVDVIPWRELTADAVAKHPKKMAHYRSALLRLADRVDRVWTPGWRSLQARIAGHGITRADNPVDTLMEVAVSAGLEPWQLDREWAWTHERSLRPDLRRKWTRVVDNFDALRDVPEIAGHNLLPAERLGPMPKVGARLKNAHLPLPRGFEAALEGEPKQVLEAAHFLWRCLRSFGVYSRGDDPKIGSLLAEPHLQRILNEQSFMTRDSARLHVDRIRDWRESRPGFAA